MTEKSANVFGISMKKWMFKNLFAFPGITNVKMCCVVLLRIQCFINLASEMLFYGNDIQIFYSVFALCFAVNRFRMRLVLSNKTQNTLGVLIHVVKGNFDFILKWPFSGEITVSMIHPVDPNLRLKSVMKTNGSEQAFQRPTLDINPRGFGFTKTVTLSELEKHGYLQDNQLIIVISVKTHNVD